ncbi:MAG: VWA domain-containing protein [Methylobacterium sp.]|nr:VWA domain-containing protein [Methylobacterium sp.]MCA3609501.1 VWA domain-containing protein [Methylobacterium sp.]MCA3618175.1 VWA domain-containing protein [Methylobacterium sp.]MCA3620187.1 VWA domain-containing protein [Methylobacterium sp.]
MSGSVLPAASRPLVAFPALLREHGFAVSPDQTITFLEAVTVLGPRSLEQVRQAAWATLAPQPQQRETFDALFDFHFLGGVAEPGEADDWQPDDEMNVQEEAGSREILIGENVNETGQQAIEAEALAIRALRPPDAGDVLARFARDLPAALPRRRGYRFRRARRGASIDLARSLRAAIRTDGDVMRLTRRRRASRPRPVLLLIDVSGSMKSRTDANLALAHVIVQSAPRVEVFTFGTRLTRVTRALKLRNCEQALAQASGLVADWDGGTRIGDALAAFLAVPRFAGYARGAVVAILSDGLERGDPGAMIAAVRRLAARAFRIDWLSPLAADPDYQPQTEALAAIRPMLASLSNGNSTAAICRHLLSLGQGEPMLRGRAA